MRKLISTLLLNTALIWPTVGHSQIAPQDIRPITSPVILANGVEFALSIYYVQAFGAYFAGCIVNDPNSLYRGWQPYGSFAHWFQDNPDANTDDSQTLHGVLNAHGGLPKFILHFAEYGDECLVALTGFNHDNQVGPSGFTTSQLALAMSYWTVQPTQWPGLLLFAPIK